MMHGDSRRRGWDDAGPAVWRGGSGFGVRAVAGGAGLAAVRRAARNAVGLESEVARLRRLLAEAAADTRKRSTIARLRMENGQLRADLQEATSRAEQLSGEVAQLRSTRETLAKSSFGGKSEQVRKPRTGRRRGQRAGTAGHGRTQRPELAKKTEVRDPPQTDRVCGTCGASYVANGSHVSEIVEVEVRAHKRVLRRRRWRRACDCASSPREVSAPPVARLFANTPYGVSFRARFLYECYACFRPVNRIAAWMSEKGLRLSAGTLSSSILRFLPLFAPLSEAILARQNGCALRQGDETSRRIQALGEAGASPSAWLWLGISLDAVWFHVDPSRSATAAAKLFGGALPGTILVADRFSAYKKLGRDLGGRVTLAWCWVHVRRDFIRQAAGNAGLAAWKDQWIARIARIVRLNKARLVVYRPGQDMERQPKALQAAHRRLQRALDRLFADAERELAGLDGKDRRSKPLRALGKHREGLSVFVAHPAVPMDNNLSERMLRGAAIGRKLSFGSDSKDGAAFTAMMYSVVATLRRNNLDVRQWLTEWLEACARNGGRPPGDLAPWLAPWTMSEERRRRLQEPP